MIGAVVISKLKTTGSKLPMNSRGSSGMISLYSDHFLHMKAIILARSGENSTIFIAHLHIFNTHLGKFAPYYTQHMLNAQKA